MSGRFYKLIESYLSNRFQGVVLNRYNLSSRPILTAVPQGFISGPFIFHIYVNDMHNRLKNHVKLFADERSISCIF